MAALGTSQRAALYLVGRGGLLAVDAVGSDCTRIHAGTCGTLLREVVCFSSGHDQVFVSGKKN